MSRLFLLCVVSAVWILLLVSCDKQEEGALDEVNDMIGYLSGIDSVLYVNPDFRDEVLEALAAEPAGDSLFSVAGEEGFSFRIFGTPRPYLFSLQPVIFIPPIRLPPFFKVYKNARCNRVHAGFVSDCFEIPAWHPKKRNFSHMQWSVFQWNSCGKGDSICVELLSPVGSVTYANDIFCADSNAVTEPIYRFACMK